MLEPVFGRHETFPPRYGWLRKAVEATLADPRVFGADDATVRLGVGKNMVRSIRYWGLAFGVIEEVPDPQRRRQTMTIPTNWGLALLASEGADPFLEHSGSLWVLHWLLLRPGCRAPTWWVVFNRLSGLRFQEGDVIAGVLEVVEESGWRAVPVGTIRRDVDCLARMYANRPKVRDTVEDVLDSPFRSLGLIQAVPAERRTYEFVIGPKGDLPDEVVGFAALDMLATTRSARTVAVAELARVPGSPGRVFKLTQQGVAEALERLATKIDGLSLVDQAGLLQLIVRDDPRELGVALLDRYYLRCTGRSFHLVRSEQQRPGQQLTLHGVDSDELADVERRIANSNDVLERLQLIQRRLDLLGVAR